MIKTCIICPMGCQLKVDLKDGQFLVTGHFCPRGETYALDELMDPKRVFTGNIPIREGRLPVISYKTNTMRKADLDHLLEIIKTLELTAPLQLGETLYRDDKMIITATRTIERI